MVVGSGLGAMTVEVLSSQAKALEGWLMTE